MTIHALTIDICKEKNKELLPELGRFIKFDLLDPINTSTNLENYENIVQMIQDNKFLGFVVVFAENRISGFSGVMTPSVWKPNYARINSRFYLAARYRQRGIVNFQEAESQRKTFIHKLYFHELDICRENNIDVCFVTRENKGKSNAIKSIHYRKNLIDPDGDWILADDYIQTCQDLSPSCIQRCKYKVMNPDYDLENLRNDFTWYTQEQYAEMFY